MADKYPTKEIGHTYGRWKVISFSHSTELSERFWLCRCECGTERAVLQATLRNGISKSCGCLHRERVSKHNLSRSPTWATWRAMIDRCLNENSDNFADYGAKGITVCERWRSFENFLADMGIRPAGTTLDRVDNSYGYEHSNCRWATATEQCRNKTNNVRITHNGETRLLIEWAEIWGIDYFVLYSRIVTHGWPVERAITQSVRKSPKRFSISDAPLIFFSYSMVIANNLP